MSFGRRPADIYTQIDDNYTGEVRNVIFLMFPEVSGVSVNDLDPDPSRAVRGQANLYPRLTPLHLNFTDWSAGYLVDNHCMSGARDCV